MALTLWLTHYAHAVSANGESDWGPAAQALTKHGYVVLPAALPETGRQGRRRLGGACGTKPSTCSPMMRFPRRASVVATVPSTARCGRARSEAAPSAGSTPACPSARRSCAGWKDCGSPSTAISIWGSIRSRPSTPTIRSARATGRTSIAIVNPTPGVVSAVIYLNADWPADAGGELVIYDADNVPRLTLAPDGGTLVLFMSDETPHEAKRATRERWSIAGWFRTR